MHRTMHSPGRPGAIVGAMPMVRARDGEKLHVRVIGRGPPCLLIHGFASDSLTWVPFVAPLSHRYRFILPDLRGFGLSRRAPLRKDCPLTVYAEDIEDILDAFGIASLPVAGISMGAFTVVQSFRLFGGRRFTRYMHIDQGPVIRNDEAYRYGLLGTRQAAFFERMERVLSHLDRYPALPAFDEVPSEVRAAFGEIFAEFSAAAFGAPVLSAAARALVKREVLLRRLMPEDGFVTYLAIMRAYLRQNYDLREAFQSIRVPMTVLIGAASRMYPPEGQRSIAQLVPHAVVREVTGAGHALPWEAPLRFMAELRAFLSV